MIIQNDKTIINGGNMDTANRLNGYYIDDSDDLAVRIKNNYPNFEIVIVGGELADINLIDPIVIQNPPTFQERLEAAEAALLAMMEAMS